MRTLLTFLVLAAGVASASGQGVIGMEKQILPMTKDSWVAFRNYDGRQWIYFTHLVSYRCGLAEIRYSLNDAGLGERFPLPPCDPERPNEIDAETYPPYVAMPLGSADAVAVQVIYADGEESDVHRYAPCADAGDSTCAVLVE